VTGATPKNVFCPAPGLGLGTTFQRIAVVVLGGSCEDVDVSDCPDVIRVIRRHAVHKGTRKSREADRPRGAVEVFEEGERDLVLEQNSAHRPDVVGGGGGHRFEIG
jgi:hypothetical protein